MALTPNTDDLAIIAALDDEPNDVGGLTATQLKAKFDDGAEALQAYINDSLIPELDATNIPYIYGEADSIQAAMEALTVGVMPDGSVTAAKLDTDAAIGNITDGSLLFAKLAAAAIASQSQMETGTAENVLANPLGVAQAISALGLKLDVGSVTASSSGGGTATATLSGVPTCVFVVPIQSFGTTGDANICALITTSQSGYVLSAGTDAYSKIASVSGTTLTLTNGSADVSNLTYMYAAFST